MIFCYGAMCLRVSYNGYYVSPACRQAGFQAEDMVHVYVLQSEKDKTLYTGITNDLDRRLREHDHKSNRSTKHKAPFALLYVETHRSHTEAREREKYLKSGIGRQHLKKLQEKYAGVV